MLWLIKTDRDLIFSSKIKFYKTEITKITYEWLILFLVKKRFNYLYNFILIFFI